jgi:hypothetical protein
MKYLETLKAHINAHGKPVGNTIILEIGDATETQLILENDRVVSRYRTWNSINVGQNIAGEYCQDLDLEVEP